MTNGFKQGTIQQKFIAEDGTLKQRTLLRLLFGHTNMQDLPGIVPFVQRRLCVQPLVALQTDQRRIEYAGQHFGNLRLAYAGFPFEQQRFFQIGGKLDGQGERPVGNIIPPGKCCLDGLN